MTMDSASAASSARGRSSTTINSLFALLHQAEKLGPAAKVFVRRRGGQTIGAIRLQGSRLVGLSGLGDHPSLHERLRSDFPEAAEALARLWAQPGRGEGWDDGLFAAGFADPDALRTSLLRQAAEEVGALALQLGRERPELVRISLDEPPRTQFTGFTALEVFLEVARGFDGLPEDEALRLFRQQGDQADAAILLLRPQDGGSVPVPVEVRGLDGVSISDVLPICVGAKEMCLPAGLVKSGLHPQVVCVSIGDAGWVCVCGEHRLAALRAGSRIDVARMLHDLRAPAGK